MVGQHFLRTCNLSLFWRFQLGGWLAFTVFTFPLKWVVFESFPESLFVSIYRDGLGFILTLGMREIYRRVYRPNIRLRTMALMVILVSLAGGVILTVLSIALHDSLDFEEEKIFTHSLIFGVFYFRTALCAGWSLLYFGIKLMRDGIDHDLRLAKAEASRQRAEMQMLRAQMNPHFLYNALNTIHAGTGRSGEYLKELVQSLAEYLRYSLENRNNDRVPLVEEFDAICGYLAVEKARFRDDLDVECKIEETLRDARVPGILLQPLVENAIKYGRKTSSLPLRVRLNISRPNPQIIRVEVANTGNWVEDTSLRKEGGVGLENLRKRLHLLYPKSCGLDILKAEGWVTVRADIPILG